MPPAPPPAPAPPAPAPAAPAHESKGPAPLGERLGYPLYHAVTGNLPVLSTELATSSPLHATAAEAAAAAYARFTGNLPVLSTELMGRAELQPGWVQLVDPVTGAPFWWNKYYRSRRDARPAPDDSGERGGEGAPPGGDDAAGGGAPGGGGGNAPLSRAPSLVFLPRSGYLRKAGGGRSCGGSKAFRERFFVFEAGLLRYYAKDSPTAKPRKGVAINLRHYAVNSARSDELRFELVPRPEAVAAYEAAKAAAAGAGKGGKGKGKGAGGKVAGLPPPDRVFVLLTQDEAEKRAWVAALRGRSFSASGRAVTAPLDEPAGAGAGAGKASAAAAAGKAGAAAAAPAPAAAAPSKAAATSQATRTGAAAPALSPGAVAAAKAVAAAAARSGPASPAGAAAGTGKSAAAATAYLTASPAAKSPAAKSAGVTIRKVAS